MLWKLIAWAIPGAQPFALLSTVLSWIGSLFGAIAKCGRAFCGGLKTMSKDPKTWVVVLVVAIVAGGYGFRLGDKWNKHLFTTATQQRDTARGERDQARFERDAAQTQLAQLEKSYAKEQERMDEAAEARKSAEAEADAAKRAGRAVSAELKRLRNGGSTAPAGAGSPKEADGVSLFKGLPALPWGGK
jgi:hypothetical protein